MEDDKIKNVRNLILEFISIDRLDKPVIQCIIEDPKFNAYLLEAHTLPPMIEELLRRYVYAVLNKKII